MHKIKNNNNKSKTAFEKRRNSKNNILVNNKIVKDILKIKPEKPKSFMGKAKKVEETKKINIIRKIKTNNSKNFIQVNTKRKNSPTNHIYNINKVIFIQKHIKKFLTKINTAKNSIFIFVQKIKKIILTKKFFKFKKNISKIKKKKQNKTTKKKILSINTNIYNTNKASINNTENCKAKEKESDYCRTSKHNKIMSYVNYKLNLLQTNNTNNNISNNNHLDSIKCYIPFSPKANATTDRKGIPLNKIQFKNNTKNIRNKNIKTDKLLEKINSKTLVNNEIGDEINNNNNNNTTEKNITFNSNLDNENISKFNNYKSNFSKIMKIHRKGLSYNFDFRESSFKEKLKISTSKELNPNNISSKNKNDKNTIKNQIKKISTLLDINKKDKKTKNPNKTINSKKIDNSLYKVATNKTLNKNENKKKAQRIFLNEKQKSKKELNIKKNNNKNNKLNVNNKKKSKEKNLIDIKKKYFLFWKENAEKKNILMKFTKLSKFLNHMNHYEKIILIKNTIQKLIKFHKLEDISDFFWAIKCQIIINVMRKLKEYKNMNNDINSIYLKTDGKLNAINKIIRLKKVINLIEKHNNHFNNNISQLSNALINIFKKWKYISFNNTIPKINEKIIDLKSFQSKMIIQNENNSDNPPLKKNLSLNKISPKIINVINVQNYNENNNYNYNFKYDTVKDIPMYPIKQRRSYAYPQEESNSKKNNNNSKSIYHKKKLGNTYINNNYNFNFNSNNENMINCLNKNFDNESKQKFDTYDTTSLILPFQGNHSEIVSLERNNIFYNDAHPEEKFGFKKLEQIEEKEINFLENNNSNNNINNANLYIKKQNFGKKHVFMKDKNNNKKNVKNSIKSLNIQFDNKNEEIIKKEKNHILDTNSKLNKIFSSKNFFTEFNYYESKNDDDKKNKSFNDEVSSTLNDDFAITNINFKNNSPF